MTIENVFNWMGLLCVGLVAMIITMILALLAIATGKLLIDTWRS